MPLPPTRPPPTSPPEAECLGAVVVDALGAAVSEDLCDRVVFEDRPYGLDAVFADIETETTCFVCPTKYRRYVLSCREWYRSA